MSDITYTNKGSATTQKIAEAPLSVQKIWQSASLLGVNILRVRVHKERYETTKGATFNGYHNGKVSIYSQRSNPLLPLWFRRFVKLGESNVGMQVLEVSRNLDVEETLATLDEFNTYINGNIFTRLFQAIKTVLA
jgi:hypothetical protein